VTVHEYIIPHVLVFRQHNGDDPPQDYVERLCLWITYNFIMCTCMCALRPCNVQSSPLKMAP